MTANTKTITDYNRLQSQTVEWLRFPLMVLVVAVHVNSNVLISFAPSVYVHWLYFSVSQVIARVSVCLFFMISGYYFFFNKKDQGVFTPEIYLNKLKNRVKTLLIPYIFWNLIVFAVLFFSNNLFLRSDKTLLQSFLMSFVNCFNPNGNPVAFQFWFIRNLIVIVILSPVLYFLLKYLKFLPVILFFLFWIYTDRDCFRAGQSLFAFSFGAYFSINNKNIVEIFRKIPHYISLIICIAALITEVILYEQPINKVHSATDNFPFFVFIIFAMVCCFVYVSVGIERGILHTDKGLSNSSFFLFAVHPVFVLYFFGTLPAKILPKNDVTFLLLYIFSITGGVLLPVFLYKILKKYLPAFTNFITGSR